MLSNIYNELCDSNNYDSITVKVEQPEYSPTVAQLNMRYNEPESLTNLNQYSEPPLRNEIYQKMGQIIGEDSVLDFIENSIDNIIARYTKDKSPQKERLRKGAERQRIYRQNETQTQRDKRLELARQYIKKKRQSENHEQRYDRLKKQRERIRAIRESMKLNPEIHKVRKQIEAERMKMRRANESPMQRIKRLEKSRMYSKKRRENEVYRVLENEKNRLAHQFKRSDEGFRLQERQKDRARKKIRKEIITDLQPNIDSLINPEINVVNPLPAMFVSCSNVND